MKNKVPKLKATDNVVTASNQLMEMSEKEILEQIKIFKDENEKLTKQLQDLRNQIKEDLKQNTVRIADFPSLKFSSQSGSNRKSSNTQEEIEQKSYSSTLK